MRSSSSGPGLNNRSNTTKSISTTPSTRKSMEEVWEDIATHSSLHHHPATAAAAADDTMMLQDFLVRAFTEDPLNGKDYSGQPPSALGGGAPPRPATFLSLNSVPEFGNPKSTSHDLRPNPPENINHGSVVVPPFWSRPMDSSSFCKKRVAPQNDDDSRDRKDKRLIKNRDSAARSRARKQAYIYELEQEVAHLAEENGKLRKQLLKENIYKRSCLAAPPQLPKKHTLSRSLTAPF